MIDSKETQKTNMGVPQGSVLGPTLRNILYETVPSLELTRDAVTTAYADDLALVAVATNDEVLVASNLPCTNWGLD